MQRLLFAMAAMGAALVFGCGATDETVLPYDGFCVNADSPMGCDPSRMLHGESVQVDGPKVNVRLEGEFQGYDSSEKAGASEGNYGTSQQGLKKAFNHGLSVPVGTTFADWTNVSGNCNGQEDTCLHPRTDTSLKKKWTWRFDESNCGTTFARDMMRNATRQAMKNASLGTGWTFTEVTGGNERITIYCMFQNEFEGMGGSVIGLAYPYGPLTVSRSTSSQTFDKCNNSGPSFTDGFKNAKSYELAGVSINLQRTMDIFKQCHGGASQSDQTFLEASIYNVTIHELGHALGFTHDLAFPMLPTTDCSFVDGTIQGHTPAQYRTYPGQILGALQDLSSTGSDLTTDRDISCLGPFDGVGAFVGAQQ